MPPCLRTGKAEVIPVSAEQGTVMVAACMVRGEKTQESAKGALHMLRETKLLGPDEDNVVVC